MSMSTAKGKCGKAKASGYCESCVNYVFDDEYQCYDCLADVDEDDMYKFLSYSDYSCPFYRLDDEYAVVRKQN